MRKVAFLLLLLVPILANAEESRFIVSPPFSTARGAVRFANSLEYVERISAQFVIESNHDAPTPDSYRVVADRMYVQDGSGETSRFFVWIMFGNFSNIKEAVQQANQWATVAAANRYGIDARFVGRWNPYVNPYSTNVVIFVRTLANTPACQGYTNVDRNPGSPQQTVEFVNRELNGVMGAQFILEFNVGNAVYGSIQLVTSGCDGREAGSWKLAENGEDGQPFTLESAVQYAEEKDIKEPHFVAFTSPSSRNPKSRILLFYKR